MARYTLLLRHDGEVDRREYAPGRTPTPQEIHEAVGGYYQTFTDPYRPLLDGSGDTYTVAFANEDGLRLGLPRNPLVAPLLGHHRPVPGNALVLVGFELREL